MSNRLHNTDLVSAHASYRVICLVPARTITVRFVRQLHQKRKYTLVFVIPYQLDNYLLVPYTGTTHSFTSLALYNKPFENNVGKVRESS